MIPSEAKQLVRFPYCRIYRRFLNRIVENSAIRKQGQILLFRYAVLFSWPASARRCALWMAPPKAAVWPP